MCSLAGRYDNPIPTRLVTIPHRLFKNSSTNLDPDLGRQNGAPHQKFRYFIFLKS